MAQGVKLDPGIYHMGDGSDHRSWTVVAAGDELGSIGGDFEAQDHGPPMGWVYHHKDIPSVHIQFLADGSYRLVKPGPDSTGTYVRME